MRLKKLVRPIVPDRWVARRRLRQHSQSSRVNVDVFLSDRAEAKPWLDSTPDTYRVRLDRPSEPTSGEIAEIGDPALAVDEDARKRALAALAAPNVEAVAVADVGRPRLIDRRRAEPEVGPRLIVTTRAVLDEVGGIPPGDHPLPGLWARLRDAGFGLGLIPHPEEGAPTERTDPIEKRSVVVLSAVPLHDVGGGSRSAQLALEFVRQGFHVSYVHLYEAQESTDLGIRFVSPDLEQYRAATFQPSGLARRVSRPALVVVEAPASLLGSHAFALQEHGWRLAYDMIDDWSDPALGGDWFDPATERRLVEQSDSVIASATDLVDRTRRLGGEAELVPNAVNAEIFGVGLPPRPDDLPEADLVIGYHGSLYGDWFDWEGLAEVARAYPTAAVMVIGDDKVERPELPANVHFLGLKAQTDLPSYLQRFDVGLIPFRVNDTTHAVSPLKVYEYLASGVPVAATPLRSLRGLPGVSTDLALTRAVESAIAAPRPDRELSIADHSWSRRTVELLESTGLSNGMDRPGATRMASRPATHFSPGDRVVR